MKHAAGAILALAGFILSLEAGSTPWRGQTPGAPFKASTIQILKVESDEVKLPAEFQMALYENLIAEVERTKTFQRVFRDGDRSAAQAPDLVVLRINVSGFKPGSERARQVTTVAGTTSIKLHLRFTSRDGSSLLERDAEGKVRLFGENLRATYNLAKNVAKIVRKSFQPSG